MTDKEMAAVEEWFQSRMRVLVLGGYSSRTIEVTPNGSWSDKPTIHEDRGPDEPFIVDDSQK